MSKKKLFLIVGRTKTGKSTITRLVCKKLGLTYVKSYTTRPMRDGENEGNFDHIFVKKNEADVYKRNVVASTTFTDDKTGEIYEYWATKELLDNADFYIVDPNGIKELKANLQEEYDLITIYIRVPENDRKRFKDNRTIYGKEADARAESENQRFTEFERSMEWEYHILNNRSLEEAVDTMTKMVRKELNL